MQTTISTDRGSPDLVFRLARGVERWERLLPQYARSRAVATSDAYRMVQPRADGREAARAATTALEDAGIEPTAIDYVNAQPSSTPLGDIAEARAIAQQTVVATQYLPPETPRTERFGRIACFPVTIAL